MENEKKYLWFTNKSSDPPITPKRPNIQITPMYDFVET